MSGTRIVIPDRHFYGICSWCRNGHGEITYITSSRDWFSIEYEDDPHGDRRIRYHRKCFIEMVRQAINVTREAGESHAPTL